MARRRRGRKGRGRRKGAFPVLSALPVVVPLYAAYKSVGLTKEFPENYLWQQTGYSLGSNRWDTYNTYKVIGLAIAGLVGHKVAGKLGVNKYIRKLSMGYIQL